MRRVASLTLTLSLLCPASFVAGQSDKRLNFESNPPFSIEPGSLFEASGRGKARPASRVAGIANQIAEAQDLVRQFHYSGSTIPGERLTKSILSGSLRSLDPHSKFYGSDDWQNFIQEEYSVYTGIGATIGEYQKAGEVATYIVATAPESSAEKAGLVFGDRIVAIDSRSVSGKDSTEIRDLLRGPKNSVVKVTVQTASSLAGKTVTLKRTAVAQPSIPDAYIIAPGIGYLALTEGFSFTTLKEFDAALASLKQQGVSSLVLDLRGNGGGIVEQAVKIAERFLSKGTLILTQRGRSTIDNRTWRSANTRPETMPLVLLVDEYSASASEIVAGSLQDNDRAWIVGSRTYGKGLVQSVIELPNGRGLTLTSARYMMPSGRSIQRDYSSTGLYDYFKHAQTASIIENAYTETRTVANRRVTGGDGINPDENVSREDLNARQATLIDPIFFFMRDLANGRLSDLAESANRSTQSAVEAFVAYVARNPEFSVNVTDVRLESEFVEMRIRFSLATMTGKMNDGIRVLNQYDSQTQRAVKSVAAARNLLQKPIAAAK